MIAICLPLFPDAAARAAPVIIALALVSIIWGAFMAIASDNLMRLIAYVGVALRFHGHGHLFRFRHRDGRGYLLHGGARDRDRSLVPRRGIPRRSAAVRTLSLVTAAGSA